MTMSISVLRGLALAAACLFLSMAALAQQRAPTIKSPGKAVPPQLDLSERMLYDLLLGEIALQRGDTALAAKTFADLARRTRDARIARRAVEVANQARMP